MSDLDNLRPEVREAVAAIDKGNGVFVNGDDCEGGIAWATVRAELLRLQSTESRANEWQLRAERAGAELAALKARIDALMLEFCPDDMTDEQRAAWAARQKPVED